MYLIFSLESILIVFFGAVRGIGTALILGSIADF